MRIFLSTRDRARPPPYFTRTRHIIWGKHWVYSARFSPLCPSIPFTSLSLFIPLYPSLSLSLPLYPCLFDGC